MALIADDKREAEAPAVARDALDGLDRLLHALPRGASLPGYEIAALVRLIRRALDGNDRDPTPDQ